MEKKHLEILLEDIRSKFDLVLEGHEVLNAKIDAFRDESNEKHEQTDFALKTLNAKIDASQAKNDEKFDRIEFQLMTLNTKVDQVKANLAAHRADTEAHPRYQVREPSP